jgi:conjugative relaxase-like TrwC/TraI family protein
MLSLRNVSAQQAKHYYKKEDRATCDRQAAKSDVSSSGTTWFGTGADRLDLKLEIEQGDFQKILEGTSPSGESLSARKIDLETRRAATDFTFSAPKSVSIAALVQGDRRVIESHDQAVKSVLTVMEEQYSQTRVRTEQGQVKVSTDNLLVGIFRHETSREQDPQLHSHALVMNCTQLGNGQWRSLSNEMIVHHSKFLGQIYQNELAHQLSTCGYEVEQRANGQFELKGYTDLVETFSTRRQQIEEHLAPIESPTLKQREHAALTTRQAKVKISAEILSQRWDEKLFSIDESAPEMPEPSDRPDLTQIVTQAAIAHCDIRGNVFRSGAAEQYVVENFTGQASLANLRNALREEAVVMDELTGLLMSEQALAQELDSIQVMEAGKRFPLDEEPEPEESAEDEDSQSSQQNNDADNAEFIAQLTQATVQYFNTQLKRGEVAEIDGNLAVVESADYWVAYHHNQENGHTPMFRIQDKATNSPIFEIFRRDQQWEAEMVKLESIAWLEQASRELAAERGREPRIQKPQIEL